MTASSNANTPHDFSLVLGGPLYQLFRRSHLSGDTLELLHRRVLFMVLCTWVPLMLLSAVGGQLLNRATAMPFLLDVEVHIRFLLAVPLLVGAEVIVHRRLREIPGQFLTRHLIPEESKARFREAFESLLRTRNSLVAELVLIALVYGVGMLVIWRHVAIADADTWYTVPTFIGSKFSAAGLWYVYVSVPVFQFLLLRWYFRIFLWARFLWQVSGIELTLVPTHPDRLGGLGFLANTVFAFMPLAAAHGVALAGLIANRILHAGATLPSFKEEIVVVVLFVQCLVFVPLLFFTRQLAQAKRIGRREYGTLAERYVRDFDAKWVRGGAPAGEPLLGSSDIQSLADFGNSYQVIREMHNAPVTRELVFQLAAATLAPIVPLMLTMMPLEELLKKLLGVIT